MVFNNLTFYFLQNLNYLFILIVDCGCDIIYEVAWKCRGSLKWGSVKARPEATLRWGCDTQAGWAMLAVSSIAEGKQRVNEHSYSWRWKIQQTAASQMAFFFFFFLPLSFWFELQSPKTVLMFPAVPVVDLCCSVWVRVGLGIGLTGSFSPVRPAVL